MPTNLSTSSPAHSIPDPGRNEIALNRGKTGHSQAFGSNNPLPTRGEETNCPRTAENGTFADIDPNFALSNAQCRAIELALEGMRWSQIARALSLNRKTLWRWKTQDIEFQKAFASARADRHYFAGERRQTFAGRAASVLAKFLDDPLDKNRLRTAQILLQAAARFNPPEPRLPFTDFDYPPTPLLTPPPTPDETPDDLPDDYPMLEPKVG